MIDPTDATYALACLKGRQKQFRVFSDYASGKQPLYFSTDAWQSAFGGMFKRLSYNRCRVVVDAYANRLIVTGWETPGFKDAKKRKPGQTEATDVLGDAAQTIWDRNRMPKRQGELFSESLRAGDVYVIVWPGDDGLARLDINRGHLIHPVYDDEYPERLRFAVKCWQIHHGEHKGHWRVNVYDPEVITRWITKSKSDDYPEKLDSFLPYEGNDGPEIDNPYGRVPVFHFGNNADTGQCGTSELVDVIPLQDGLNKSIADMLVAGEYVAFPQRWVTGVAPTTNPFTNEEEEQFKAAVDRIWAVMEPDAKFGQFEPSNMAQYTDMQDAWDLKISRVSMVPVHWLSMTGDFPSGESLKTAEGPFTSKLKDRQTGAGGEFSDLMSFAIYVEGGAEESMVTPIWSPAETRSELEALTNAAMKKSLGIPDSQLFAELGYSQDEISEFIRLKDDAAQKQMEQFATQFDRGNVPVGGA